MPMAIRYYLQPNPLDPESDIHFGRIVCQKIHDTDSIISEMLKRGTTLTEPDLRAALSLFFTVAIGEVTNGNAVNLPLVNMRAGMKGTFTGQTDIFDPDRHTKRANVSPGTELMRQMNDAQLEKVKRAAPEPQLIAFTDFSSGTSNQMTPGGIAQLIGSFLKFDAEKTGEGLFLVHNDGTSHAVNVLAQRTEKKLIFNVPSSMPSGNYRMEVRKGFGRSGSKIRVGKLQQWLTII